MPSQIIGHEKQRSFLKRQIIDKRFISPVILYGPEGIGKKLVAREALEHFKSDKIHIDCTEFKPESKSSGYTLEQIHAFIEDVQIKPFENTIRAFIFDDAHKFMPVHANALLKTLEQLDPNLVVFFITHNLSHVIPTIRSRCSQIYLHSLNDDLLCQILEVRLEKNILKRACGSVKKAQLLLNPDFLNAQKSFMQAIMALYSSRFDQINILLDQIQKILIKKPKDWVEYLLELLVYFQLDRFKLKHHILEFTFPENKQVLDKLINHNYPNIESLQGKIYSLLSLVDMGMSVKYVLEQGLFFTLLETKSDTALV